MFRFLAGIERFPRKRILALAVVTEARLGEVPNPLLHEVTLNLLNHTIEDELLDSPECRAVAARACAMALTYLDASLPAAPGLHERVAQGLRDLFGPLLFRPRAFDAAWRSADVLAIAQAIYDERAGTRTPILGDALEDAGCTDGEILHHCRQPGRHVRGCWVVDQVLAKQ